jgi:hypothetical protein
MDKFKVGDTVYITKPNDPYEFPEWTSEMDSEIDTSKQYEVTSVSSATFRVKNFYFSFAFSWGSLVKRDKYYHVIRKIEYLNKKFESRKGEQHAF